MRALVVEDQPKLASLIQRGLSEDGYAVDVAPDGPAALVRATATEYDVIVLDDDGVVLIPKDLVAFVAEEGAEHERYESWVVSEVERGVKLPGLYPPNDDAKARYEAWKNKK